MKFRGILTIFTEYLVYYMNLYPQIQPFEALLALQTAVHIISGQWILPLIRFL